MILLYYAKYYGMGGGMAVEKREEKKVQGKNGQLGKEKGEISIKP